jgi:starvation-inducible DNA-binding protein
MTPNIGISAKNLKSITGLLSNVLSDAMLLYIKTRKFHWNVAGNSFMELHKLFEKQYKILEASIDEIAERINKLGAKTPGTMQEFLQMSSLKEAPGKYPSQKQMLSELLKDHEAVIIQIRKHIDDCDEKYGDIGTSDFLTDLIKEHETIAWTLRRYLESK